VRTLIIIAVLALAPAGAAAQPMTLSLDEATVRAFEASHRIAELQAREQGAEAAADGRQAAGRPQVSVLAGYTRTNHVDEFGVPQPDGRLRLIYPDIPDNYRSRLDVAWPLYTGGRLEALARAARAEAGATTREVDSLRADVRLEVARAYWSAVTATATVRVVEEALARTDAHVRDLRARLGQGLIPPNEVLTAQALRSRHEVQVIESRAAAELAFADLRRLAGLPPAATLELVSPLEAADAAGSDDFDTQVARARASRPERGALVQRLEAAAARLAAAGSARRPTIALAGGYDYARPNARIFPRTEEWQDSWDVSVNASWSLWDGGRRGAEQAEASAAARALRARLAEFDSLVELEVRQRRLELASGRAAARAAAEGVESAAEARRVLGERFHVGVATSTEVLDAQVAWLQAELDRTRALAAVRIAESRLARTLGQ
jgi:outer membrane protein TolC